MALESRNPTTDQPIRTYPEAGAGEVAAILSGARIAFGGWRRTSFGARGVEESGHGRELSVFGIREFVNVKTVYVA